MAKRKSRRDEWHLTKQGWTRSFGERGLRIRLFQKRTGGNFYRCVWQAGHGRDRKCLETRDRAEAERIARELLARVTLGEVPHAEAPVTLSAVLERYCNESGTFLDNAESTQREARTRVKILLAYFRSECEVQDMTENDVLAYTRWRMAGGAVYDRDPETGENRVTGRVRMRSVEGDLQVLYAALKWATTVRVGKGRRLLAFHPLQGVRRPHEKNPKRPLATWERFQQARQAAQELTAQAEALRRVAKTEAGRTAADADYDKWVRAELALVLVEATGRRAGSVRQLRWEDIDFAVAEITWRAEADKKHQCWLTPIPAQLLDELREFRRKLGAVGGWLFPATKDQNQPVRRDVFERWIWAIERHAKLPELDGGLLHPYRRKWATERKNLPIKDVAAAGGWKDVNTLLTCYQQADRQTVLAVMSEPRKVTERGLGEAQS